MSAIHRSPKNSIVYLHPDSPGHECLAPFPPLYHAPTRRFLNALRLIKLAVSLGSTESLAEHPATMTHADVDEAVKANLNITASMLRLSVGVENWQDLCDDIEQALAKA